jgi:hypothetical protein
MEDALYAKNLADAKLASLDKSNDMHSFEWWKVIHGEEVLILGLFFTVVDLGETMEYVNDNSESVVEGLKCWFLHLGHATGVSALEICLNARIASSICPRNESIDLLNTFGSIIDFHYLKYVKWMEVLKQYGIVILLLQNHDRNPRYASFYYDSEAAKSLEGGYMGLKCVILMTDTKHVRLLELPEEKQPMTLHELSNYGIQMSDIIECNVQIRDESVLSNNENIQQSCTNPPNDSVLSNNSIIAI